MFVGGTYYNHFAFLQPLEYTRGELWKKNQKSRMKNLLNFRGLSPCWILQMSACAVCPEQEEKQE